MASTRKGAGSLNHPARSIDELEQRSHRVGSAYGFSLWKLLFVFNLLAFAAGVTRYLWGQALGDAFVIIVLIGALAPMAILVYQSAVFLCDRWMPRKFSSPVQDVLDVEGVESATRRDSSDAQ